MTMEKIVNKINHFQEQNCISNEYISCQLEISVREFNKILSGNVDLKLSKLNKIATILKVDLKDLF
jgi:transcriptional regulator with XRE-family HTH domain